MTKPKDATLSSQSSEKKSEIGTALAKNKEIKKLLDMGVQRGYLTFEEVNELMPPEIITPESIDEIMNLLAESEIEVLDTTKRPKEADDEEEGEEAPLGAAPAAESDSEEAPAPADFARS